MIQSINPYTGEVIKEWKEDDESAIESKLQKAQSRFKEWRKTDFSHRSALIRKMGELMRTNSKKYAKGITEEMGKPISQSVAEIEKCAWLCDYYADHAESQLQPEYIATENLKSYVRYDPIGVVLAVMPWNYPYWQVMRFAVPALMAGNVAVLKHASSVMGCSQKMEELFVEAGFPEGCFTSLIVSGSAMDPIVKHDIIKAVTLTGSKPAGGHVASLAGELIKKSVLELGGNNALVVMKDVDITSTVETCVKARYQNTGQSCIAGKRLFLHEAIYDEFIDELVKQVKDLKSGDPTDEDVYIGVCAREDLAEELEEQMNDSLDKGAELLLGGKRDGAFFEPTIITGARPGMTIYDEETFGPLLAVRKWSDEDNVVDMVNQSKFGLGVSVFTKDLKAAEKLAPHFEDGAVFINDMVKSNPNLPFGGTKISGYGRELSHFGITEFVNKKTVVVNQNGVS